MAETVKILSPAKTVLIPTSAQGVRLPIQSPPKNCERGKANSRRGGRVHVNTTAAVKALTDICCTSSNAVEVVASIPPTDVLFCPDQFLGAHVRRMTGPRTCTSGGRMPCARRNGDELA